MKKDLEAYMRWLISELQKSPLDEPLKTQIVTSIEHAEYKGAPFVRIHIPAQTELTTFNGEYPIRKNTETVNMTAQEAIAQQKLFARSRS